MYHNTCLMQWPLTTLEYKLDYLSDVNNWQLNLNLRNMPLGGLLWEEQGV